MTSNSSGRGVAFGSRVSVPTFGNLGNALLERRNPGIGRSTPDSEVLASSDEEMDLAKRSTESRKAPANRRTSLLAEPSIEHRRSSFANSNTSQPNTPGTGQDTWAAISPSIGHYNGSSFPFGQSIWSGSREPPLRFSETRQDTEKSPPSSTGQPGQTIYRSLSFSVGQKDNETTSQRPSQTLQRRTSRQNTLAPENGGLERVNEDENMHHDAAYNTSPSLGRQGGRALSTTTMSHTTSNLRGRMRSLGNGQPDLTLDDTEESASQLRYPVHAAQTRRLSDLQSLAPSRQPIGPPYSNSIFRNTRIAPQWSTGDYDPLEAIPQSRRHSFADVPTRRGSLGSEDRPDLAFGADAQVLSQDAEPVYFSQDEENRLRIERDVKLRQRREQEAGIYNVIPTIYGVPQNMPPYHGPARPPLYVVNFKCSRSDIFYIQEGSDLTVQPGDLVSVEADRGTDLGCVQHIGLGWDDARKYKARYAEQHFGWLMMFSQQTRSGAPNVVNPNAVSPGRGGAGVNSPSQGLRDNVMEIKPKMIKRHAQPHEIQGLQEKEGDEAKAKRICQSKVVEHGLNMEILDAEFQFDRKKLTFYFFSNEYINFNALVTDLFKMYKTRIWMSAINPASFQSPVSQMGLTPLHSGMGLGVRVDATSNGGYDDGRGPTRYTAQPVQSHRSLNNTFPNMYGQATAAEYGHYSSSFQPPTSDPFSNYVPAYFPGTQQIRGQMQAGRAARMPSGSPLSNQFGNMSLDRYGQK